MSREKLRDLYRDYIDCLNRQDWDRLCQFVDEVVHYNGRFVGLSGYRNMLEEDFRAIPDLFFKVELLIADEAHIASRLYFDCTPHGVLFGLPVNGKRVKFVENVFYEYSDGKISKVWSLIDKEAIAQQI